MGRNYTAAERERGMAALDACEGSAIRAARQTGIPESTLRGWYRQHYGLRRARDKPETEAERLRATLEQLQQQLAADAVLLAGAVRAQIEGAPLNQLATALGTVIDRCLKINEHLAASAGHKHEGVLRIEYVYPDGSIHPTAPWAADDPEEPSALSGGGLRAALWQDGDGEDSAAGEGADGRDVLVAGADLRYGEPGVARHQDGAEACTLAGD